MANRPLGKEFKTDAFGEDHSKQGMCIFNTALLSATHRVTVEDAGAFFSVYTGFEKVRGTKFRTAVCKDNMEQEMKIVTQTVLKAVKDDADGTSRAPIHQEGKEQLFLPQIESQQHLFRIPRRMYGIHFGGSLSVVRIKQEKIAVHTA